MTSLVSVTCDRAFKPGEVPAWVQLLPAGRIVGRDGRSFVLADAAAVVQAFRENGADLPIDCEHQSNSAVAKLKGPVRAAGWIKEIAARPDGIWGRVEWTAAAAEMIASREYRYLSPVILCDPRTKVIARIAGAGLVHNPNLHLAALNSEETPMDATSDLRAALADALGLPPETPDAELVAALRTAMAALGKAAGKPEAEAAPMAELVAALATPDPAKYLPIATVQEMLRERRTELSTASEERVQEKVSGAVREGLITPGMMDWATALCGRDEASFDAFLKDAAPVFAHFGKRALPSAYPAERNRASGSPVAEAICAQLGLAPGSLKD